MELFGIGILEILFIVLIALIFLGPQDTVRLGRNLGRAVRRFFSSEEWRTLLQATREIRTIPDKLLEETGLDHPEDLLPSEAEIRQEAGLDDLAQNMTEWNADLTAMKNTGQAPAENQVGQIMPPRQVVRREAGLEEVERNLSEWKADLSAWGNSSVIIPTPQPTAAQPPATPAKTPAGTGQAPASAVSGQDPTSTESKQEPASAVSGQDPTSTESKQEPASADPVSPSQDQPESEAEDQEPATSNPSEQERT